MRYPEKIYEQAKDLHVRNIVLYNVNNQIAYDSAGTNLLSKEEIVDAFLKGCVVNNNGSYTTPTGVNVDGDTATLVFDGGSSGGGMVVHFEISDGALISDKTVAEVAEAGKTMPISGSIKTTDGTSVLLTCMTIMVDDIYHLGFAHIYVVGGQETGLEFRVNSVIIEDDGVWKLNI